MCVGRFFSRAIAFLLLLSQEHSFLHLQLLPVEIFFLESLSDDCHLAFLARKVVSRKRSQCEWVGWTRHSFLLIPPLLLPVCSHVRMSARLLSIHPTSSHTLSLPLSLHRYPRRSSRLPADCGNGCGIVIIFVEDDDQVYDSDLAFDISYSISASSGFQQQQHLRRHQHS